MYEEPTDSTEELCQSLYGRSADYRDYGIGAGRTIRFDAARVIGHLSAGLEYRDRKITVMESQLRLDNIMMDAAGRNIKEMADHIEKLESDNSRLRYYERVMCIFSSGPPVMTPDGAVTLPNIEKMHKVADERDALRKELAEVKLERDQACDTLAAITELV